MVAPVSTSTATAAAAASRISAGGARALASGVAEVGGSAATNAFTTGYESILYNDYGQRQQGQEGGQDPQRDRRNQPSDVATPNGSGRQGARAETVDTQGEEFAVKLEAALRNLPPVMRDTDDPSVNSYIEVSRTVAGQGRGQLLDLSI